MLYNRAKRMGYAEKRTVGPIRKFNEKSKNLKKKIIRILQRTLKS